MAKAYFALWSSLRVYLAFGGRSSPYTRFGGRLAGRARLLFVLFEGLS